MGDTSRWPLVWWELGVGYTFSKSLPEKIATVAFGKSVELLCFHRVLTGPISVPGARQGSCVVVRPKSGF